ncbi:hypothetical protein R3P38DRAFT_3372140, partial [Favolaschia claudopus]
MFTHFHLTTSLSPTQRAVHRPCSRRHAARPSPTALSPLCVLNFKFPLQTTTHPPLSMSTLPSSPYPPRSPTHPANSTPPTLCLTRSPRRHPRRRCSTPTLSSTSRSRLPLQIPQRNSILSSLLPSSPQCDPLTHRQSHRSRHLTARTTSWPPHPSSSSPHVPRRSIHRRPSPRLDAASFPIRRQRRARHHPNRPPLPVTPLKTAPNRPPATLLRTSRANTADTHALFPPPHAPLASFASRQVNYVLRLQLNAASIPAAPPSLRC